MKSLFLLAALAVFTATARADDLAAVAAAERARGEALRRADAKSLADLLADDLRYVHSNGRIEDKISIIESLRDGSVSYPQFETMEHHASRVTADVVVLSGKIDQRKVNKGAASEARLFFQSVWRRDGGTWRMVSIQTAQRPVAKN